MELVRWEPFDGLNGINARINDLFDDALGPRRSRANGVAPNWLPPVDILESKDAYLIRAEVPGMKKDDFTLEVKENHLTLSGDKKREEIAKDVTYHRGERVAGKITRSFYFPQAVNQSEIKATYRDGILEIQVPKADEAKPRQIAININ